MKKSFDTLVVGATAVGIGYAAAHPGTLVIDSGEIPFPEFVLAVVSADCGQADTDLGRALHGQLDKYGIVHKNNAGSEELDVQRFSPVSCKIIREMDIAVLLLTRIVSIREAALGGFDIEIHNNEGVSAIHTNKIVDTASTPSAALRKQYQPEKQVLHLLASDFDSAECLVGGEGIIKRKEPNGLWNLGFSFDSTVSITQARERIIAFWQERLSKTPARIVMLASEFQQILCPGEAEKVQLPNNWIWCPACGYSDLMKSFEKGGSL